MKNYVAVEDWEWGHSDNEEGTVNTHSMVVGGVLLRWWGDTPPAGVAILAECKRLLDAKGVTR